MPVIFIAVFMALCPAWLCSIEAMAKEPVDEITVWSEFIPDSAKDYTPDSEYVDQEGQRYWLKSWKLEPELIPKRQKAVEKALTYEAVERKEEIPQSITITSQDQMTGQQVTGEYPAVHWKSENERWLSDFSFTAVFHSYDADYYELSGKKIPFNSQKPELIACEAELLSEIGADPDQYRILDSVWQGGAYWSPEGDLCRNALVTGERRVADYQVVYKGKAVFSEAAGERCQAIYRSFAAGPENWYPAEEQEVQPWNMIPASEGDKGKRLLFKKTEVLVISLLIIVAVIILIILSARRLRKSLKEKEKK